MVSPEQSQEPGRRRPTGRARRAGPSRSAIACAPPPLWCRGRRGVGGGGGRGRSGARLLPLLLLPGLPLARPPVVGLLRAARALRLRRDARASARGLLPGLAAASRAARRARSSAAPGDLLERGLPLLGRADRDVLRVGQLRDQPLLLGGDLAGGRLCACAGGRGGLLLGGLRLRRRAWPARPWPARPCARRPRPARRRRRTAGSRPAARWTRPGRRRTGRARPPGRRRSSSRDSAVRSPPCW